MGQSVAGNHQVLYTTLRQSILGSEKLSSMLGQALCFVLSTFMEI